MKRRANSRQTMKAWVLENTAGTKAEAAKALGISRKSLWEKCKRFGIA